MYVASGLGCPIHGDPMLNTTDGAAQFGFIPQNMANTFGADGAAAFCKLKFGHGWNLATFDDGDQLAEAITHLATYGHTESLWVGYTNSDSPDFIPWNTDNTENPEPNGLETDCVRVKAEL